ncbi:MAG: tetratricopeptide repeat protein [bacterium]
MYFTELDSFFYLLCAVVSLAALCTALVLYRFRKKRRDRHLWVIESLLDRMEGLARAGSTEDAEEAGRRITSLLDVFPPASAEKAGIFKRLSEFEEDRHRLAAAEDLLAEALRIDDAIDNRSLEPFPDRVRLALLKSRQGRLREAIQEFEDMEERLKKHRSSKALPVLANVLNQKSLLLVSEGKLDEAVAGLDRALDLEARYQPDSETLVIYHKNRGDLEEYQGNPEAALGYYKKGLEPAVRHSYSREAARLADRIRLWYMDRPRPEEEPVFWRRMYDLAEESEHGSEPMKMFAASLAEVCYQYALEEDPELLLDEALKGEEEEDSLGNAFLWRARARLELSYGEYGKALPGLKKAFYVFSREMGSTDTSVLNFVVEIGDIYMSTGSFEKALSFYREAESVIIGSDGGHHPGLPSIYLRIVECLTELQEVGEVKEYCRQALEITEKISAGSALAARLLFYQARAEVELGKPANALGLLEQSRDICRRLGETESEGTSWFFLSTVHQIVGDLDQALHCARMAKESYNVAGLSDPLAMGDIYARLSSVYAGKGEDKKSVEFANYAMNTWAMEKAVQKAEI